MIKTGFGLLRNGVLEALQLQRLEFECLVRALYVL